MGIKHFLVGAALGAVGAVALAWFLPTAFPFATKKANPALK